MSTPRSRAKSKRVLPNIPSESNVLKRRQRGVTFNSETMETSDGGTQMLGKIKEAAATDTNNLSAKHETDGAENVIMSDKINGMVINGTTKENHLKSDLSLPLTGEDKCMDEESDKENLFDSPRPTKFSHERLGVKESNVLLTPGFSGNNFHIDSPSPNMKVFHHRTPIRRHTMDEKVFSTPECYKHVQFDKMYFDFGYNDRVDDGEDSCSVTVAVRVRPFSTRYKVNDTNIRCSRMF